jgi:hypothetical protein
MWEGVEMSRPAINGLNLAWDSSCMETINIPDPSRLRVPFPGRGQRNAAPCPPHPPLPEESRCEELVLDISSVIAKTPRPESKKKDSTIQIEAWTLSVAYVVFSLSMALYNLFTLQASGRTAAMICTGLSPVPVLCLLLQAATANSVPVGMTLLVCALLLPSVCAIWILPISVFYIIVLALCMLAYSRQRGVVAYVSCIGAVLSLAQTAVYVDPQWGVSVSLFFLTLLCFNSCCERIYLRVWL